MWKFPKTFRSAVGDRLMCQLDPKRALNAHYQLPALVNEFRALKEKAMGLAQTPSGFRDKTHDPRPREQ